MAVGECDRLLGNVRTSASIHSNTLLIDPDAAVRYHYSDMSTCHCLRREIGSLLLSHGPSDAQIYYLLLIVLLYNDTMLGYGLMLVCTDRTWIIPYCTAATACRQFRIVGTLYFKRRLLNFVTNWPVLLLPVYFL